MDDKELSRDSFPSNSNKKRSKLKLKERKIDKIITGNVKKRKRGFGKRVAETFINDDAKSVGSYIFYDVLVPAAKSMINEMVISATEMLLFGERRGHRTRREGGSSYISYGSYFRQNNKQSRDRTISRLGRARHDFDEIVLETRGEAEEVLSHLVDLVIDYEIATVADLYDLVGITSSFTDNKYGWMDLSTASTTRVRDGYLLNLPQPHLID